ncbi:MAG TPA: thiamine phosphate synthase [Bryobacteraceae bacterium]|nr:thiamine phosphate synthase [Bryobacteraceae bacterium]
MTLPKFYPILDTTPLRRASLAVETAAEALLEGGAKILQLRHKGDFTRETFAVARRVHELCVQADCLFVINDRVDVALLLDSGVHLGQDDLPPAAARKLCGPTPPIGFSTHNEAQLMASAEEPIDYVALGPLFSTATKENPDPVVGLAEFQRLRKLTAGPMVAIGGITRERAASALAAGADSLAVIGDLFPEEPSKSTLRARTEEWIQLLKR